jgi:hypothetical protein
LVPERELKPPGTGGIDHGKDEQGACRGPEYDPHYLSTLLGVALIRNGGLRARRN